MISRDLTSNLTEDLTQNSQELTQIWQFNSLEGDYCAAEPASASFNLINIASSRDKNFRNFTEIIGKYSLGFRISDFKQDFSSDFSTCVQDFTPVADRSIIRVPC